MSAPRAEFNGENLVTGTDGTGNELFLAGPAGRLEALAKPRAGAHAAALVCHPHPQYGGTMHNKVVYRTGRALHGAGLSVLRFNFRGVGASEGTYDGGHGERDDTRAALDHLARPPAMTAHETAREGEEPQVVPHRRLVVAGFSFGAWVGLDVGARDPRVEALVGIGLPVNVFDFDYLANLTKPLLVVQGDDDEWGELARVRAVVAAAGPLARLEVIAGADHLLTGKLDVMMDIVTAWSRRVVPVNAARSDS